MTRWTITILSVSLFVLTLLWGGFTLLVYLGVPAHQLVYMPQEEVRAMDVACGDAATAGVYVCRGMASIGPFVVGIVRMGSPFLWYAVLCLLSYVGYSIYRGYVTGYFSIDRSIRPVWIIAWFFFSVWLIATTLSMGTLNNASVKDPQPFARYYEPTQEAYSNVQSESTMTALQENYQRLLSSGCLRYLGSTAKATKIYDLTSFCMQKSFFARAGGQFVMILLLVLDLLVAGSLVLKLLRLDIRSTLLRLCVAIGIGGWAWVSVLWLLSVLSLLVGPIVWGLVLGLPLVAFPVTLEWLRAAWTRHFHVHLPFGSPTVLLGWLLLSYLALNFLNVVRPFPIGWDDLGSYLNRPRLLASYGSFIPSMSQFQWEYLSSLGYVLFGLPSAFGSTFAMMINWLAGAFAVLSAFTFGRIMLGQRAGILTAIVYYFLPMTGHFSFADMKIDNAVFFTSVLAILCVLVFLVGTPGLDSDERVEPGDKRLLMAAGVLAGFSFAIKPTAILTVLMIVAVVAGNALGWLGFAVGALLSLLILVQGGTLSFATIQKQLATASVLSDTTIILAIVVGALACFAVAASSYRSNLRPLALHLGLFTVVFVASILPWTLYNSLTAQAPSLSPLRGLKAEDYTSPQVSQLQEKQAPQSARQSPTRYLPPALKLNPDDPACRSSSRTEELDRYWGFNTGWRHFLTLPWREVMNADSYGYYVTLSPMLLLVPLILLLPFFWAPESKWLRLLFGGTFLFLLQWTLVANGIMWYGITMFLGLALFLEVLVSRAPDLLNRIAMSVLLTAGIMVCLVNRFWQFDAQKNLYEYPLGKIDASTLQEMTIPDYDDISRSVVSRHKTIPDRPYTYRIGTFISYFIPQNREILPLADHQLGFFNCINQEKNHALTLKRLEALGFNSIIFDTNTHTIEKDLNGSLHQKVKAFLDFANDPALRIESVVNNPGNGIAYMLLP